MFSIYILFKINNIEKEIKRESKLDILEKPDTITPLTCKKFKRIKLAWFYSPDNLERYLENMELKGYNLCKVGKLGIVFTFIKGTPRKVKYIADFQTSFTSSYYETHKQDNWKLVYNPVFSTINWVLWSKEYINSNEIPNLYTDTESIIKQAKKSFIIYSLTFLPCILVYGKLIYWDITHIEFSGIFNIFVYSILLLEYLLFYYKSASYFFRIRKKVIS